MNCFYNITKHKYFLIYDILCHILYYLFVNTPTIGIQLFNTANSSIVVMYNRSARIVPNE